MTKFLFINLLFLSACSPFSELDSAKDSLCHDYVEDGWQINEKACYEHIHHPKRSKGETYCFESHIYGNDCTITIDLPEWNLISDKPMYMGYITCPNSNERPYEGILEENLRDLNE